jgi:hypothetical protein
MSKHHNRQHKDEPSLDTVSTEREGGTSVRARVTATIKGTASTVSNMVPTKSDLRNLSGTVVTAVKENPIGALLSGLAVGFLVGSLLPSTPVEDERLGALKNTLQTQAHGVGTQAIEHGKAVIRDTIEAAQQSAQQHGAEFAEEIRASV